MAKVKLSESEYAELLSCRERLECLRRFVDDGEIMTEKVIRIICGFKETATRAEDQ